MVAFLVRWVETVGLHPPGASAEEEAFQLFFLGALAMSAMTFVGVCGAVLWALNSRPALTKT